MLPDRFTQIAPVVTPQGLVYLFGVTVEGRVVRYVEARGWLELDEAEALGPKRTEPTPPARHRP